MKILRKYFVGKLLLSTPIIVAILNSLIYWPLLLRLLDSSKVGQILFLMQISLFLTVPLVMGINFTFVTLRNNSQSRADSEQDVRIIQYYSISAIPLSVVGAISNTHLLDVLSLALAQVSCILLLALYRGRSMYKEFLISSTLIQFVVPFLALFIAVISSPDIFIPVMNLTTAALVLILSIRISLPGKISLAYLGSLIRESIYSVPFLFGNMILLYGNKIYLGLFFNDSDVAHFQIPSVIGGGLLIAYNSFSPILFDSVLTASDTGWRQELKRVSKNMKRYIGLTLIAIIPVGLLTYILSPITYPRNTAVVAGLILASAIPILICTDFLVQTCLRSKITHALGLSFLPVIPISYICIIWLNYDPIIRVSISTTAGITVRYILLEYLVRNQFRNIENRGFIRVLIYVMLFWSIAILIFVELFL